MNTEDEYAEKLCPTLPPQAQAEAILAVADFKKVLLRAAEECLDSFYCDQLPWLETDMWINMRQQMLEALCDYPNLRDYGSGLDAQRLRQAILRDHRDELVADLNQDLRDEVAVLKRRLESALQRNHSW